MTTFGNLADILPSDEEDEDDEEYVPEGDESSCGEITSEEEVDEPGNNSVSKATKKSTKRKAVQQKTKKDGIAARKRRRGCFEGSKESALNEEEKNDEGEKEEKESVERKGENSDEDEACNSKRSDSLWQSFLQRSKQPLKRENNTTKTVERLYDFAGETVRVTQEVAVGSKAAKKLSADDLFPSKPKPVQPAEPPPPSAASMPNPVPIRPTTANPTQASPSFPRSNGNSSRGAGVAGLLDKLSAKKKMSVLDKSRLDWDVFTSKEGIKEELQIHNRGKDGYLEKVEFLERADYRQFENERDMRLGVKRSKR